MSIEESWMEKDIMVIIIVRENEMKRSISKEKKSKRKKRW